MIIRGWTKGARIAALTLMALSATVSATYAGNIAGRVNEIVVGGDGGIMVNVDGTYSDRPACSVQGPPYNRLVIDRTQASGQRSLYAALLAALHAGHNVTIVGTGTCAGTSEVVAYMHSYP